MTQPPTTKIAAEIDRLVIAVHRGVMSLHRLRLQKMLKAIGVASPGHFYDLAEFLEAGACTAELARHRFRYDKDDTAGALIAGLHDRQLVGDQLQPSEAVIDVIDTIFLWRGEVAARLWGSDLVTANDGAAEALQGASGPVTETFRSLAEPAPPAHRLHHRLTGLRYARLDAHIAAWEDAELTALEIVALTSAIALDSVSSVPDALVARGWLTVHGAPTSEGHAARSRIQAQTDSRCDVMFGAVAADPEWLAAIGALAGDAA